MDEIMALRTVSKRKQHFSDDLHASRIEAVDAERRISDCVIVGRSFETDQQQTGYFLRPEPEGSQSHSDPDFASLPSAPNSAIGHELRWSRKLPPARVECGAPRTRFRLEFNEQRTDQTALRH